jgi:hypothetical protein
MNEDRHIWEGWHVSDFIEDLEEIWKFQNFHDAIEIKFWCMSEQPYYKKHIPEVYKYFVKKWKENEYKSAN